MENCTLKDMPKTQLFLYVSGTDAAGAVLLLGGRDPAEGAGEGRAHESGAAGSRDARDDGGLADAGKEGHYRQNTVRGIIRRL